MESLLEQVSSPGWWIGVVLTSFAINLGTAYLKPRLDHLGMTLSQKRARRRAAESAEREARVRRLIEDRVELLVAYAKASQTRFECILYFVGGLTFAVIALELTRSVHSELDVVAASVAMLIGIALWLMAVLSFQDGLRILGEISEAEERRRAAPNG